MQNVDTDPKEQQPTQQDTSGLVVARNGALRDPVTGRIVANPGGGKAAITPANASALAESRWQRQFAASRRKIREISLAPSSIAAYAELTGSLYEAAMNTEKPLRDRVMAAKFVGTATDLLPTGRLAAESGNSGGVDVFVDHLRKLRAALFGE